MHVYIDETGDTGMQFDKKSSTHFVVGLITAEASDGVREAARAVRQKLHWPDNREFKFSGTHDVAKTLYLHTVRRAPFGVHAVVFDKFRLDPDLMQRDFYGYLVAIALEDVIEIVRGAHLLLDESFQGKHRKRAFRGQLRSRLGQPGRDKVLKSLSYQSSHANDMLQLADMAVGAIARAYRSDRQNDDQYKKIIEGKIVSLRHFP